MELRISLRMERYRYFPTKKIFTRMGIELLIVYKQTHGTVPNDFKIVHQNEEAK